VKFGQNIKTGGDLLEKAKDVWMSTFFKITAFLWLAGRELKAVFQVSGRLWTT